MMSRGRRVIDEGTVFAVPLREGNRFATGVVARMAPGGRVALGYFFGPARDVVPRLDDLGGLCAGDAQYVTRFGDLGLVEGDWPIIGSLPSWRRGEWPLPEFCRPVDGDRAFLAVSYTAEDVSELCEERRVGREECGRLPEDGLAGAGFVELRLTRLLNGAHDTPT